METINKLGYKETQMNTQTDKGVCIWIDGGLKLITVFADGTIVISYPDKPPVLTKF